MPSLGVLMKSEISRIARKESRAETAGLKKQLERNTEASLPR